MATESRVFPNASEAWFEHLNDVLVLGRDVAPRGLKTKELLYPVLRFRMAEPAVWLRERKVDYTFMAAEALWILSGSNEVEDIAPYCKHIAKFSDDGETFFGAYGPKVVAQLQYVVDTLLRDPDSRQALLTLWRENPPATKDVPCTIALQFMLRGGALHCCSYMRSNDVWLGTVYDVFNFSMIAAKVVCMLNQARDVDAGPAYRLGMLVHGAASSHLYESNFDGVRQVLKAWDWQLGPASRDNGDELQRIVLEGRWDIIKHCLTAARDKTDGDMVWRVRPPAE